MSHKLTTPVAVATALVALMAGPVHAAAGPLTSPLSHPPVRLLIASAAQDRTPATPLVAFFRATPCRPIVTVPSSHAPHTDGRRITG